MLKVGLRELKSRLAKYIRRVRAGESVLITDRGSVVAELRPPGHPEEAPHHALARLVQSGHATQGGENDPALYPQMASLVPDGTSARLIDDERSGR